MSGHLYELVVAEPARFRAYGMDSAFRIQQRVSEAARAALTADPEVIEVEDVIYLKAQVQTCDGTGLCRAGLHTRDCPRFAS